jgi:hypothetical protein
MREPDEETVASDIRNVLREIRNQLSIGAKGAGTMINADDCATVLACLADPAMPSHRVEDTADRDEEIFRAACLREREMPRSQAVAETAALFGESKWTVNRVLREREAARMLRK